MAGNIQILKIIKYERSDHLFEVWYVNHENDHAYVHIFARDELDAWQIAQMKLTAQKEFYEKSKVRSYAHG